MPRLKHKVPGYCHHKRSGQARVRINGREHWLGPYGSPESKQRYDQLIADYLGRRRQRDAGLSVGQLTSIFWAHCKKRYRRGGKGKFGAAVSWRPGLRLLRRRFGKEPVAEFGPRKLRQLRDDMVAAGWSRSYTNDQVNRVKRCFRWAASEELIPFEVSAGLDSLEGLRRGQTAARETDPVLPVDADTVAATLPHLSPVVAAMVQVQRLCGCRPAEICSMLGVDVDRSGDVWIWSPQDHKNAHRDHRREIYLGPKAQEILLPSLLRSGGDHVFRNRLHRPFVVDAYRRAIHRGCDAAGIDRWSPNRLRHAAATEVRKEHGLEAAQLLLGHTTCDVTQVYAERDRQRAVEIARQVS